MRNLGSDINNTPKTNTPRLKEERKIDIGNTIEYDVTSYQVKNTIVKCKNLQLKVFNINR